MGERGRTEEKEREGERREKEQITDNVPVDVWEAADAAGAIAEEPETTRADSEGA